MSSSFGSVASIETTSESISGLTSFVSQTQAFRLDYPEAFKCDDIGIQVDIILRDSCVYELPDTAFKYFSDPSRQEYIYPVITKKLVILIYEIFNVDLVNLDLKLLYRLQRYLEQLHSGESISMDKGSLSLSWQRYTGRGDFLHFEQVLIAYSRYITFEG